MKRDTPGVNVPEPGFDPARLQETSCGDPEFEREITNEYLDQARSLFPAIEVALEGGEAAEVSRLAHTLKGSSRAVGAEAVAAICAELERIADSGDLSTARGVLERAAQELAEVRARLADYFGSDAHREAG